MSVALYTDVHVPSAVTRGLLLRNVDVLTAQLDGTTELDLRTPCRVQLGDTAD